MNGMDQMGVRNDVDLGVIEDCRGSDQFCGS